jgi:hypothetical protein
MQGGKVNEERVKELEALPVAESHRLIDFERAEVVTLESFPPQFVLTVSGTKPYANMEVELAPLVYIRQPEYWGIEVVGHLPGGIGLPVVTPYSVSLPLAGTLGTRGIEVIGASRSEKIDVPGGAPDGFPEPNLFELTGGNVEITYGILRARGEFLDYRDRRRDLTFGGQEIDSLDTRIGRMHTVTLEVIPDRHELTLTLLLPQINLEGQRDSFETFAVRTTHLTSIGGPGLVEGPLQTYDVVRLRGKASQAD